MASSNLATEAQYAAILDFVTERAKEIGESMKAGVITPAPYRKGTQTPCDFCKFRSVCRHDYEEKPKWRNLKKLDKKEFWETILPEESAPKET